jgi:hypothetical protein
VPNGTAAVSSRRWLLLAIGLALVPVYGLFSTSRIFFVRDLSFFFWSRHLWLRHTIFAGTCRGGTPYRRRPIRNRRRPQSAGDAGHAGDPPAASDVVSFNLWVGLPLPVAAAGMFLFLRQRLSPAASTLGASVFALAGPTISMLNTPNLSWSVALAPWVLWSVGRTLPEDATGGMRGWWIALTYALQALCGEPVTWVATGLLAAAWSSWLPAPAGKSCPSSTSWRVACWPPRS